MAVDLVVGGQTPQAGGGSIQALEQGLQKNDSTCNTSRLPRAY